MFALCSMDANPYIHAYTCGPTSWLHANIPLEMMEWLNRFYLEMNANTDRRATTFERTTNKLNSNHLFAAPAVDICSLFDEDANLLHKQTKAHPHQKKSLTLNLNINDKMRKTAIAGETILS